MAIEKSDSRYSLVVNMCRGVVSNSWKEYQDICACSSACKQQSQTTIESSISKPRVLVSSVRAQPNNTLLDVPPGTQAHCLASFLPLHRPFLARQQLPPNFIVSQTLSLASAYIDNQQRTYHHIHTSISRRPPRRSTWVPHPLYFSTIAETALAHSPPP